MRGIAETCRTGRTGFRRKKWGQGSWEGEEEQGKSTNQVAGGSGACSIGLGVWKSLAGEGELIAVPPRTHWNILRSGLDHGPPWWLLDLEKRRNRDCGMG